MSDDQSKFQTIASWLHQSERAAVFTGAGISTESGIPDFRSPVGVWSQNRTVYFDEFLSSEEDRYEYWRQKSLDSRRVLASGSQYRASDSRTMGTNRPD